MPLRSGKEYSVGETEADFDSSDNIIINMAGDEADGSQQAAAAAVEKKVDQLVSHFEKLLGEVRADGALSKNISETVVGKLNENVEKSKPRLQSVLQHFQPDKFGGEIHEGAKEFLDKFTQYAAQAKYTVESEQAALFKCFLKDKALYWFEKLPTATQQSFKNIGEEFLKKFGQDHLSYAEKLALLDRNQSSGEGVENYMHDIHRRFDRCSTAANERLHIFLKGLLPELRRKVLEKDVSDYEAAITEAIRIERLTKVANVYDRGQSSANAEADIARVSSASKPSTEKTIRDIVLEVLDLKDMKSQKSAKIRPIKQKAKESRPTHYARYDSRQDIRSAQQQSFQGDTRQDFNRQRGDRPPIVCFYCQIPGHKKSECYRFKNDTRARQPSLPGRYPPYPRYAGSQNRGTSLPPRFQRAPASGSGRQPNPGGPTIPGKH